MSVALFSIGFAREEKQYAGFGLGPSVPSPFGGESLVDDLLPKSRRTGLVPSVPRLSDAWVAPVVRGRVSPKHDSPGINLIYPAFSKRACDLLHDILSPNGELLPLATDSGDFYFYHVTTYLDAFDRERSVFTSLKSDPLRVVDVEVYAFIDSIVESADVFRTFDEPVEMVVSQRFVDRVCDAGLRGFMFTKMWPHPDGVKWRFTEDILT